MKTLLCPCEDVTLQDVEHALAEGHCDIESLKRYTGFGTGICQGKSCLSAVAQVLHARGPKAALIHPFTPRTPLYPTSLSLLASMPDPDALPASGGTPRALPDLPLSCLPRNPLPAKANVVIIGGGIMGLALAHNLALRGERDVVVLEKSYLCAGASGRNGGGVRTQWGTALHIELSKRSIELMKQFAGDTGMNIWLRQGGYLFLAQDPKVAQRLERSVSLHNRHGVATELLTPEAARELVPQLSLRGVSLCAFNRDDGVVFPWPFLWGYAQSCQKHSVRVETFTSVSGFEIASGQIRKVKTPRGDIACERVVLAAGAWSPQVAKLAGIHLPSKPKRHEILSTEPLKPFLNPLVSVLDSGLYFSQSLRGELVGGMGNPKEPDGLQMGSSFGFLGRFARAVCEQAPILGGLKVVRQWAGCYDVTPDNSPILGATPGLPNLLQMSGFVGHGFMMAPAVAERMAEWILHRTDDELFTRFGLQRFQEGRLEREEMIIG